MGLESEDWGTVGRLNTVFCSGRQSMGCDLHTVSAKSAVVSDYGGFPGLTTEHPSVMERVWLPSFLSVPRKDGTHCSGRTCCLSECPSWVERKVALVRLSERWLDVGGKAGLRVKIWV